jgi:hypothetical protein
VIKALNIVDDATHEAVAISGYGVARVLGRLALNRGLRQVIRTHNGNELYSKAMVACAYERRVQLRLIQLAKPNQNAYIESLTAACSTRSVVIWGCIAQPTTCLE